MENTSLEASRMSEAGLETPKGKNAREAYRDAIAAVRKYLGEQKTDTHAKMIADAQLMTVKQIEATYVLEGMRIPVSPKGIREESFAKTFYPVGKRSDGLSEKNCHPRREVMIRHIGPQGQNHARSWVRILEVKPDEKDPDVILAQMEFLEDAPVISDL